MVTVGVFERLDDATVSVTESKVLLLLIGDLDEVVTVSWTVDEASMLDIPYGVDDVFRLVTNVEVRLFGIGETACVIVMSLVLVKSTFLVMGDLVIVVAVTETEGESSGLVIVVVVVLFMV